MLCLHAHLHVAQHLLSVHACPNRIRAPCECDCTAVGITISTLQRRCMKYLWSAGALLCVAATGRLQAAASGSMQAAKAIRHIAGSMMATASSAAPSVESRISHFPQFPLRFLPCRGRYFSALTLLTWPPMTISMVCGRSDTPVGPPPLRYCECQNVPFLPSRRKAA